MSTKIFNKHSAPVFILIVAQQIVVSSSTFFLTQAAEKVASGQSPSWLLYAYLASLVIPFFPGIAATIFLTKWEYAIHKSYLNKYLSQFRGRLDLWRNGLARSNTIGLVSQEIPQVSEGWSNYHFNLFATALNVILNVVVVAVSVDASFLTAFAISLLISAIGIKLCSQRVKLLTENAQKSRIKLSGLVSGSWSSVVLGNTISEKRFRNDLDRDFSQSQASNLSLVKFTSGVFLLMVMIAFVPSLLNVVILATKWNTDYVKLAALLVILPRLFMILNFTYDLLQQVFSWNIQKSRINGVDHSLSIRPEALPGTIDSSKIKINGSRVGDDALEDLVIKSNSVGRYTIEGENGSGKSTLLLMLKQKLKDRAHYVSPSGDGNFVVDGSGKSTGQSVYTGILSLMDTLTPGTVLLLDEWSANLDSENRSKVNALIAEFAKQNCVVEVLHRA